MMGSKIRVVYREASGYAVNSNAADGRWYVKSGGVGHGDFRTKREAVSSAKSQARNAPGKTTVVVENKSGGVSNRFSYNDSSGGGGSDPMDDILDF